MSSTLADSSAPAMLVPGKKYRFFARSAEEAVQVIHDRMGPAARVVAVEQVGGQGLSRLLRSPRLEVIAMIPVESAPAPEPPRPVAPPPVAPAPRAERLRPRHPASEAHLPPRPETAEPSPAEPPPAMAEPAFAPPPVEGPGVAYTPTGRRPRHESRPGFPGAEQGSGEAPTMPLRGPHRDLRSILQRLGFGAELLDEFVDATDPRGLGRATWTEKLDLFFEFLWGRYRRLPNRPLAERVAFFGTPGSGITTALCKELTTSVFLRGEQPLVACLEHDHPSSSEALRAYCELMQVPLVTEERGAMAAKERVFWDIPGISSRDFDTWNEVGARLDELLIQSRVFVTHAAFDTQHLVQLLRTVEAVRPTHLVLTHLDEATQPARLWDFLHTAGLCPLFASESPSVTGGRRDDFHAALLAQTFPSRLNAHA